MKISNIYLGLIPIVRAYQNDKIIWDLQNKISVLGELISQFKTNGIISLNTIYFITGDTTSKTYASGKYGEYPQFSIKGTFESMLNGIGVFTLLIIFPMKGILKNTLNAPGAAHIYDYILTIGNTKTKFYENSCIDPLRACIISTEEKINFYDSGKIIICQPIYIKSYSNTSVSTKGNIYIYQLRNCFSEKNKTFYLLNGNCSICDILNSKGEIRLKTKTSSSSLSIIVFKSIKSALEIKYNSKALIRKINSLLARGHLFSYTKEKGGIYVYNQRLLQGISTIEKYTNALINFFYSIVTKSNIEYKSYIEGSIFIFNNVLQKGETDIRLLSSGKLDYRHAAFIKSNTGISTNAGGKIKLWHLPIQKESTLYIKQAFNTTKIDNTLSIT